MSQIVKLSYFPQIKVVHTSTIFHQQIYVPAVNWLLLIGTICVTAAYGNVSFSYAPHRKAATHKIFRPPSLVKLTAFV